jgi:hypothetical protein
MSNEVIRERESQIKCLELDLRELKNREKIIKSCGFQHRVPFDFFQLKPEEFDSKIYSLWEESHTITMEEYLSYLCKKNDGNIFVLTPLEKIEKFILGYNF